MIELKLTPEKGREVTTFHDFEITLDKTYKGTVKKTVYGIGTPVSYEVTKIAKIDDVGELAQMTYGSDKAYIIVENTVLDYIEKFGFKITEQ